jgi:hypothetical protein
MPSEKADYSAMTVNERLSVAGLHDQYDAAAESRNRETMIRILTQVDIPPEQAAWIADTVLADPGRYGY